MAIPPIPRFKRAIQLFRHGIKYEHYSGTIAYTLADAHFMSDPERIKTTGGIILNPYRC
jgi:hypothetical protein